MVQITVRDVDKEVFREFKAAVTRQGVTIGTALSLAMEKYQQEVHLDILLGASPQPCGADPRCGSGEDSLR